MPWWLSHAWISMMLANSTGFFFLVLWDVLEFANIAPMSTFSKQRCSKTARFPKVRSILFYSFVGNMIHKTCLGNILKKTGTSAAFEWTESLHPCKLKDCGFCSGRAGHAEAISPRDLSSKFLSAWHDKEKFTLRKVISERMCWRIRWFESICRGDNEQHRIETGEFG